MRLTQPHDPAYQKGRPGHAQREYEIGCANWKKARAASVPIMTGTDTGFAITPYGEWNARELGLFVEDLGFSPAAALRAATEVDARFMTAGDRIAHARARPGRRFRRTQRVAARRYQRVAGSRRGPRGLYRRQGDPHRRSRLRSAPSHRFCTIQLDRYLHQGARRRIAGQAPKARRRRVKRPEARSDRPVREGAAWPGLAGINRPRRWFRGCLTAVPSSGWSRAGLSASARFYRGWPRRLQSWR